jgi:hypothetical protein
MAKKILINENDLSKLVRGIKKDKLFLEEGYSESWLRRVWNTPWVMTDEYLKLFFPDVDKLKSVTSFDSVNRLRRYINRIFAKRKNWVNLGGQGYLKLEDGSSVPVAGIRNTLEDVINQKKTYAEIANDIPFKLANGERLREEFKIHLEDIQAINRSKDTGIQDTKIQDTGNQDTKIKDTGNQDTKIKDTGNQGGGNQGGKPQYTQEQLKQFTKVRRYPWIDDFTYDTIIDWDNDGDIDWDEVYPNHQKMSPIDKVEKLKTDILKAIHLNNYKNLPSEGFETIVQKNGTSIRDFSEFVKNCVRYADGNPRYGRTGFSIKKPRKPKL